MQVEAKSNWKLWVHQPQRLWLYNALFHVHFMIGALVSIYIGLISLTGSIIVYRDELAKWTWVERLVKLHTDLLAGSTGRTVNGIGALCLLLLCLTGAFIWWPGVPNWRRSLTVNWTAHFARINWDVHSALGFWCFGFLVVWAATGVYFAFPDWFNVLFLVDPNDKVTDRVLFALAQLHFGRFGWISKVVWAVVGLVPAVLGFTGMFICCRRIIYGKQSNPHR
jgi:uncharacterized iron-regulated membrane protein